jgi:hypothetical protein
MPFQPFGEANASRIVSASARYAHEAAMFEVDPRRALVDSADADVDLGGPRRVEFPLRIQQPSTCRAFARSGDPNAPQALGVT